MIVQGPDGREIEFPDGTPEDVINDVMEQEYNPAESNVAGKEGQSGAGGPSGLGQDIAGGIVQGARNFGEHLLGLPGQIDMLERKAIDWLKAQKPGGYAQQAGQFLQAGRDMMGVPEDGAELLPGVPAPNWDDMQWLTTQATGIEPFVPQTTAGQAAMYGTELAIPGAAGLKGITSFGKWALPRVGRFARKVAAPTAGGTYAANELRKMFRDEQGTSSDHYR